MDLREIDIWKLESQEKIRKLSEDWAMSLLGKRARRMMNAEQAGKETAEAAGGLPADAAGYGGAV